jgi:hypothetical protein
MHLSSHTKQPAIDTVYLGIPLIEAVVCENCNAVTKVVNARCGICKSEAITWVTSVVPGHPRPPRPLAAVGIPSYELKPSNESVSLLPPVLRFLSWLFMPLDQPSRKPDVDWLALENDQRDLEKKLAIPTFLRERDHPAA